MSKLPIVSNADTALLGLLCEEAMHPWQIEKIVRERSMRAWTDLSQAAIYKQLRTLQRAGLVACRRGIERGRLRKVYSVTPAGRAALRAKLRELLTEPEPMKWRVDLGIYNLNLLPSKDAVNCLKLYRQKLEAGIACYQQLVDYMQGCGCSIWRRAVARRPQYLLEGEIRWVDVFLRELKP
jgi:DNA-binding PadR family transcriptional regulator